MTNDHSLTKLRAPLACAAMVVAAVGSTRSEAQPVICEGCAGSTIEEICAAGATEGELIREATPDQEARCQEAMDSCPVEAIGCDGDGAEPPAGSPRD